MYIKLHFKKYFRTFHEKNILLFELKVDNIESVLASQSHLVIAVHSYLF